MNYPDPKYFDYSASAPPFISALEQNKAVFAGVFCQSLFCSQKGVEAMRFLLEQKEEFCNLLNFSDGRLLLTSSGTEANNTVLEGHIGKNPNGRLLIAENVHNSVWYIIEKYKGKADIVKIDRDGQVNPLQLEAAIKPDTSLVCISHVCNETGAIHDLKRSGAICNSRNIKLLVDGAQAIGHIPIDFDMVLCDYYSFSGHKFGSGRSFGGLLFRDDSFKPLLNGGNQEWSLRAGTENLAGLAAGVKALSESLLILESEEKRLNGLKKKLTDNLKQNIPGLLVNNPEQGLPGFVSVSFPGYKGGEMVKALSLEGFYVSTGSACHDNLYKPSRIILATGRTEDEALGDYQNHNGQGNNRTINC